MTAIPPVTVVVPTHNHADTLDLSVRSVLEQEAGDLAVVIAADGIGDDTRDVISGLRTRDARVRVVDRPKSGRTGEPLRNEILSAPDMSPIVGYHGDDDLMLPDHVSTMLSVLEGNHFAHPLPLLVKPDDSLLYLPMDLARPACVAWQLAEPPRNAISLTGVMHTLASYRALPHGWRETPPGRWTDHYMWQQYLSLPGLRARTSTSATTLKLVGDAQHPESAGPRISAWWDRMHASGFREWWDRQVIAAVHRVAVEHAVENPRLRPAAEGP